LNAPFKGIFKGFDFEASVVESDGGDLLVQTNKGAPNYRVVAVPFNHPEEANWKSVIPEQKEVMESVGTAGGSLFAGYLKDASARVVQYDLKGNKIRDIQLPGLGTVGGFGAKK